MSVMKIFLAAILAQLAAAHFDLNYPYWRGDSFDPGHSQYTFPCESNFWWTPILVMNEANTY
jgi:hypothetical protein